MIDYLTFDVKRFLRDSLEWNTQLDKLRAELDSIPELSEIKQSAGRSNDISRPVENVTLKRSAILAEISQIEAKQAAKDHAFAGLSLPERELIQGFYFSRGSRAEFVRLWCAKYNTNRDYCYTMRNNTLAKLADKLFDYTTSNYVITRDWRLP